MAILGNLFLILASFVFYKMLNMMQLPKAPASGYISIGKWLGDVFLNALFLICMIVATICIARKNGFDWLPKRGRYFSLAFGLLVSLACTTTFDFSKYQTNVSFVFKLPIGYVPAAIRLILILAGFILLNEAVRAFVPTLVYKIPLFTIVVLSILICVSAFLGIGQTARKLVVPQFPQTDNPACRILPFQTDTDSIVQTFIVSPDKKNVFVLTNGVAATPEKRPCQILKLDMYGQVLAKIALPDGVYADVPYFWWEPDANLSVQLTNTIQTFAPDRLKTVKTWHEMSQDNFLSDDKLILMEFHEKEDAYYLALQAAIKKSVKQHIRKLRNLDYIMLDFTDQNAEYWYLYPNTESTAIIAKFAELKAPINAPSTLERVLITDGDARITVLEKKVRSSHSTYAYPYVKSTEEWIVEIAVGKQQARFTLTNKDKHSLSFSFADNQYLQTANGVVWLMHERVLYRIEMPQ